MAGRASLLSSDLSSGLAAAVRTARKVDLSDSLDAIRTDVGERVEVGRELVGDAAESLGVAVARMQGRSQRRSRRRPALIGLAIGIIGVIALAAWWRRRHAMHVVVEDEALDRELLDPRGAASYPSPVEAGGRDEIADLTPDEFFDGMPAIDGRRG